MRRPHMQKMQISNHTLASPKTRRCCRAGMGLWGDAHHSAIHRAIISSFLFLSLYYPSPSLALSLSLSLSLSNPTSLTFPQCDRILNIATCDQPGTNVLQRNHSTTFTRLLPLRPLRRPVIKLSTLFPRLISTDTARRRAALVRPSNNKTGVEY